jgi:TetR/AcrR family transcriptional regulator
MARPASDMAERILDAAREQFARSGVDGASLRAIASAAGTSVAMIAYHFENKDGLFRAVVDRVYDPFVADLEAVVAAESDPLERLKALLRRIGSVSEEERATMRIVLREATIFSERLFYVLGRFMPGHGRLLRDTLSAAQEAGELRAVSPLASLPSLVAPVILPQVFRPAVEQLFGNDLPIDALVETALDISLNGLLPR